VGNITGTRNARRFAYGKDGKKKKTAVLLSLFKKYQKIKKAVFEVGLTVNPAVDFS